jgi:hypothetical protein
MRCENHLRRGARSPMICTIESFAGVHSPESKRLQPPRTRRRRAVGKRRSSLARRSVQVDRNRGRPRLRQTADQLHQYHGQHPCRSADQESRQQPPNRNHRATSSPWVRRFRKHREDNRVPAALSDPCDVAAGPALLLRMCLNGSKKEPGLDRTLSETAAMQRIARCQIIAAPCQRTNLYASVLVRQHNSRVSWHSRRLLGLGSGHAHQCRNQHPYEGTYEEQHR